VQISEDKVVNSGLSQGAFLKRHKISTSSGFIGWKDFQVGSTITLYGRTFNISNCDTFTKEFYDSNGCPQQDSASAPDDSYTIKRAEFTKPPRKGASCHRLEFEKEVEQSVLQKMSTIFRHMG